ncbi:hypothetical protein CRUP_020507 [Coryphaenoides rupestris]|nr:hypothetical protein CRUP_020507 [Coryphaenoides rupestris]
MKESLRSYTHGVKAAVHFLLEAEATLLPVCGLAGDCSSRLEELQQALASLEQRYQDHVDRIQGLVPHHLHFHSQKVERLHQQVLSGLLVRMTTFSAQAVIRTQELTSCAERSSRHLHSLEEISQSVRCTEEDLRRCLSTKVSSLSDCNLQQCQLKSLLEEALSTLGRLEVLEQDACPEQGCRGDREAAVAALWWQLSRLQRDVLDLSGQSGRRSAEWSDVTESVERSSSLLDEVEVEEPVGSPVVSSSSEDLQDQVQMWDQYRERLDWEHRALSALELRIARLLGVPAHLEQAPPTPLCQQVQAMQSRYHSLKERSGAGREVCSLELEEREQILEEAQGVRAWLEAADCRLLEPQPDLQELPGQLLTQKALLQRIMDGLRRKYSDTLPVELETQLQEVTRSLQEMEVKVGEAVALSRPLHRLGSKLAEFRAGLDSVRERLEQSSPSVAEAEKTQKRAWDELDVWHSCLAALEVELQYLEVPHEAAALQERLCGVQTLHSQLAKQAEQRTRFLSKIPAWLRQHQEMIGSSRVWLVEAQTWLSSPCTYTSAKCLLGHVHALKGFGAVLADMASVCDVTALQQQLDEADGRVAAAQESFVTPLTQLEHTAAEVEAIESEVRSMENNVSEIKALLSSPETLPSPREDSLKVMEERVQCMRRTVAEIQRCRPDLGLPEHAQNTLAVFAVVDRLQTLLLDLEKKIPALFLQLPPTPTTPKAPEPRDSPAVSREDQGLGQGLDQEGLEQEGLDQEGPDQGLLHVVHLEEDVLQRSGATLLTVQSASPDQRLSRGPAPSQQVAVDTRRTEESGGATAGSAASTPGEREGPSSAPGTPHHPLATARTQSQTHSMVNTTSSTPSSSTPSSSSSSSSSDPQQRCVVS